MTHRIKCYRHWLFCSQKRQEVKLKDAATRVSAFGILMSNSAGDAEEHAEQEDRRPLRVVRRVASASSIYSLANPSLRNNRHGQVWGGPLSTQAKLVSPRPLGATHILVAYTMKPANTSVSSKGTLRPSRRKAIAASTFSELVELPINDLLFILNVPNLMPPRDENSASTLPRRLHKEMPRVLMQVPQLEAFPELVVYLHTKNQAALFRSIIPEWIRDIMHPLPAVSTSAFKQMGVLSMSTTRFDGINVKKLIGKLVTGSASTSSVNTMHSARSSVVSFSEEQNVERVASDISIEVAEAAQGFGKDEHALIRVACLLNALRDNLSHIGYFRRSLWVELDLSREIILGAVTHFSKIVSANTVVEEESE